MLWMRRCVSGRPAAIEAAIDAVSEEEGGDNDDAGMRRVDCGGDALGCCCMRVSNVKARRSEEASEGPGETRREGASRGEGGADADADDVALLEYALLFAALCTRVFANADAPLAVGGRIEDGYRSYSCAKSAPVAFGARASVVACRIGTRVMRLVASLSMRLGE
jgi:hypothetical protein